MLQCTRRRDDTALTKFTWTNERPAASCIPVVRRIAASGPTLAEAVIGDVFPLPKQIVGEGDLFLLKIVGNSMVDAAICDGDWAVVRQQPASINVRSG